jgi:transposase
VLLDLRKKIVAAKERGMPTSEVARTFGVGLSTVKRYAAAAREGRSLAPKKRPGSKPKLDEAARRLLEADIEERPAATLPERREFLSRVAGVRVSDSTVSRMLKRLGWSLDISATTPPFPATKDDCKKGGWMEFGYPDQGTCVSDVNRRNR